MQNSIAPKHRLNDLVVQNLAYEVLIYDLEKDVAFCLNRTSAMVWNICDGNKSISEISRLMTKELKSKVSEDFVWLAIEELNKEGLLSDFKFSKDWNGMSRRQVVKKVGLATMIALPLITNLTAPKAVHAASACGVPADCPPTGNPCIARTCISGVCGTAFVPAGACAQGTPYITCDGSGGISGVSLSCV